MKIHMEIANGYKNGRLAQLEQRDGKITRLEATQRFIQQTYGEWIIRNLGTDFHIEDLTEQSFTVNFTYRDDAIAFQKTLGGKQMEEQ